MVSIQGTNVIGHSRGHIERALKQFKVDQEIEIVVCRLKDPSFILGSIHSPKHQASQSVNTDPRFRSLSDQIFNELVAFQAAPIETKMRRSSIPIQQELAVEETNKAPQVILRKSSLSSINSKNLNELPENMIRIELNTKPSIQSQSSLRNEEVAYRQPAPATPRRGLGKTHPAVIQSAQYSSDSGYTESSRKSNKSFYSDISIIVYENNEKKKMASSAGSAADLVVVSVSQQQAPSLFYHSPVNSHLLGLTAAKSVSINDFTGSILAADRANFYKHQAKGEAEKNVAERAPELCSSFESYRDAIINRKRSSSEQLTNKALDEIQIPISTSGREKKNRPSVEDQARKLKMIVDEVGKKKTSLGGVDSFEIPISIQLNSKKAAETRGRTAEPRVSTTAPLPKHRHTAELTPVHSSSSIGSDAPPKIAQNSLENSFTSTESSSSASTSLVEPTLARSSRLLAETAHPVDIDIYETQPQDASAVLVWPRARKNKPFSINCAQEEPDQVPHCIELPRKSGAKRSERLNVERVNEEEEPEADFKSYEPSDSSQSSDALAESAKAAETAIAVRLVKRRKHKHLQMKRSLTTENLAKTVHSSASENAKSRKETNRRDRRQRFVVLTYRNFTLSHFQIFYLEMFLERPFSLTCSQKLPAISLMRVL